MLREVFGQGGLGVEQVNYLFEESGIFADFYGNFDRVLLAERSAWFGGRSREEIFREVAARALDVDPQPWGESRRMTLFHLMLGGKLPRFLGFDRGPIPLPGGRATISQGQVYRRNGRTTSFAPGFRFVADLSEDGAHTSLCGGASDRRFSGRYCSELEKWRTGSYKKLSPRRGDGS